MQLKLPPKPKRKKKGKSAGFWLAFWFFSFIFLLIWWLFWSVKNQGLISVTNFARPIVNLVEKDENRKKELETVFDIFDKLSDNQSRNFVLIFQDSRELRPGGGRIEKLGLLKIRGSRIQELEIFDIEEVNLLESSFLKDEFGEQDNLESSLENQNQDPFLAPFPAGEILPAEIPWGVQDWNWSADFSQNAEKFSQLHFLEDFSAQKVDGVLAISNAARDSFSEVWPEANLKEENPEVFWSRELIWKTRELFQKAPIWKKLALVKRLEQNFKNKDLTIWFSDSELQGDIQELGWSGEFEDYEKDYFFAVDANLESAKTDQVVRRTFEYEIDLSREKPRAKLVIHYNHFGRLRDRLISDYQTFLRVYVPEGAWLISSDGIGELYFEKEEGRKYFGGLVFIPLGKNQEVTFEYKFDEDFSASDYSLVIQKQAGIEKLEGTVKVIFKDGSSKTWKVEAEKSLISL